MPKVHVVLASLEKITPTLNDVAQILRVLARSATGQDMSVYTTLSTGPRRAGDPDGPEEYHVVLLDNGRSATLGGPFAEMLRCIRCGACMNHCPVYHAVGGHAYGWVYPGPMGAVLTPLLIGVAEGGQLPNASTFCGRCEAVCPMRIPLPKLMRTWREREFERAPDAAAGARRAAAVGVLRQAAGALSARRRAGDARARPRSAAAAAVSPGCRSPAAGRADAISPRRRARPFRAAGGRRAGRPNERARRDLRLDPPLARTSVRSTRRVATRSPRASRRRRSGSFRAAATARRPNGWRPSRPRRERVQATVAEVATAADVPAEIARYLRENNLPATLRFGDDQRLADMPWAATALEIARGASEGDDLNAVSAAFAAVAETGTLALVSGPDNPTTLNFLPDNHFVVLFADDLVGDVESVFAKLRALYGPGAMPRTVNFITGPSRSADIEQTLLLGAHGPRRLHIVVVKT